MLYLLFLSKFEYKKRHIKHSHWTSEIRVYILYKFYYMNTLWQLAKYMGDDHKEHKNVLKSIPHTKLYIRKISLELTLLEWAVELVLKIYSGYIHFERLRIFFNLNLKWISYSWK